jgi:hypothetical protein
VKVKCVEDHQGVFTKTDRASSWIVTDKPRELAGRIGPDELIACRRDGRWIMIVNSICLEQVLIAREPAHTTNEHVRICEAGSAKVRLAWIR